MMARVLNHVNPEIIKIMVQHPQLRSKVTPKVTPVTGSYLEDSVRLLIASEE